MSLPKKLNKCPRSPECVNRLLYQDDEGNLWNVDHNKDFVEHKCSVKGSDKPAVVYLAEWLNNATGRTRWVGPVRMKDSTKLPPPDKYRARGDVWELKGVYISDTNWKLVDDQTDS